MAKGMIGSVAAGIAGGLGRGMSSIGETEFKTRKTIEAQKAISDMELEKNKRLADYKVKLESEAAATNRARVSEYQTKLGTYADQLRNTNQGASETDVAQETIAWGRRQGIPEEALTTYHKVAYPDAKVVGAGGSLARPSFGGETQELYVNPSEAPEIAAANIEARARIAAASDERGAQTQREITQLRNQLETAERRRQEEEERSRKSNEARFKAKEGQVNRLAEEIAKRRLKPPTQAQFGEGKVRFDAETSSMERELRRLESDLESLADEMQRPRPQRQRTTSPATPQTNKLRPDTQKKLDQYINPPGR